jgi:hypothetical protein
MDRFSSYQEKKNHIPFVSDFLKKDVAFLFINIKINIILGPKYWAAITTAKTLKCCAQNRPDKYIIKKPIFFNIYIDISKCFCLPSATRERGKETKIKI